VRQRAGVDQGFDRSRHRSFLNAQEPLHSASRAWRAWARRGACYNAAAPQETSRTPQATAQCGHKRVADEKRLLHHHVGAVLQLAG
jgi:hypothetical protein